MCAGKDSYATCQDSGVQGVCFVELDHFRHLLKSFTTAVEFEPRHAVLNSDPLVEEIKTPLGAGGRIASWPTIQENDDKSLN